MALGTRPWAFQRPEDSETLDELLPAEAEPQLMDLLQEVVENVTSLAREKEMVREHVCEVSSSISALTETVKGLESRFVDFELDVAELKASLGDRQCLAQRLEEDEDSIEGLKNSVVDLFENIVADFKDQLNGLVLAAKMDAENGVLSGANGQSGGGSASSDGVHDEILTVCKAEKLCCDDRLQERNRLDEVCKCLEEFRSHFDNSLIDQEEKCAEARGRVASISDSLEELREKIDSRFSECEQRMVETEHSVGAITSFTTSSMGNNSLSGSGPERIFGNPSPRGLGKMLGSSADVTLTRSRSPGQGRRQQVDANSHVSHLQQRFSDRPLVEAVVLSSATVPLSLVGSATTVATHGEAQTAATGVAVPTTTATTWSPPAWPTLDLRSERSPGTARRTTLPVSCVRSQAPSPSSASVLEPQGPPPNRAPLASPGRAGTSRANSIGGGVSVGHTQLTSRSTFPLSRQLSQPSSAKVLIVREASTQDLPGSPTLSPRHSQSGSASEMQQNLLQPPHHQNHSQFLQEASPSPYCAVHRSRITLCEGAASAQTPNLTRTTLKSPSSSVACAAAVSRSASTSPPRVADLGPCLEEVRDLKSREAMVLVETSCTNLRDTASPPLTLRARAAPSPGARSTNTYLMPTSENGGRHGQPPSRCRAAAQRIGSRNYFSTRSPSGSARTTPQKR